MIEELFIPYNEAQALRELGFDELCLAFFKDDEFKIPNPHEPFKNSELPKWFVTTPLYQQAFKFFREKYGLYCYISPFIANEGERRIVYDIFILEDQDDEFDWDNDPYSTYEEAELECLRKLIEISK